MEGQKTITIAIAEDHTIVRKALAGFINGFGGFEITISAKNGNDVMRQLQEADALPDICVLDINMPELNGFETLARIRDKFPDLSVLILSMYNSEQVVIKAFRMGARGYLQKDCDPLDLKSALLTVHEGELYHPDIKGSHFNYHLKARTDPSLPRISEKEMQFLPYCCTELAYKEIADKMGVTLRTVQGYRDSLFDKLNLKTRTGLVMYAIRSGLVPLN